MLLSALLRPGSTQAVQGLHVLGLTLIIGVFASIAMVQLASASSGELTVNRAQGATTQIGLQADPLVTARFEIPQKNPFPLFLGLQLVSSDEGNGYRAKVSVSEDGNVNGSFSRVQNGVEIGLGQAEPLPLQVNPGERIYLGAAVTSETPVRLYLKAWKEGGVNPVGWQIAAEDDGDSPRGTKAYAWSYLSASAAVDQATVKYTKVSMKSDDAKSKTRPLVERWVTPHTLKGASSFSLLDRSLAIPTADSTGPQGGSALKQHHGDIVVTEKGTVLQDLDVHGFVIVQAPDVVIRNSIIRGGPPKGHAIGLITNYGNEGLVIEDTLVKPDVKSVEFDGIKGDNFEARRVHVIGGVDNIKIHGEGNVVIENSLLEDTDYFPSDPLQAGGPTHNDNIQILSGQNIVIENNVIQGSTNFAIMGGAELGPVDLKVNGNYLDGGHCTMKLTTLEGNTNVSSVVGNIFGPNRKVASCPFTAYPDVHLREKDNIQVGGKPVEALVLFS